MELSPNNCYCFRCCKSMPKEITLTKMYTKSIITYDSCRNQYHLFIYWYGDNTALALYFILLCGMVVRCAHVRPRILQYIPAVFLKLSGVADPHRFNVSGSADPLPSQPFGCRGPPPTQPPRCRGPLPLWAFLFLWTLPFLTFLVLQTPFPFKVVPRTPSPKCLIHFVKVFTI